MTAAPPPDPPIWPTSPWADIKAHLAAEDRVVVVLDDDPTGTQTVHGVAVLTTWGPDELAAELITAAAGPRCFFVLTNSRSLNRDAAVALAGELGANLRRAVRQAGHPVVVISRSDSTLRGHFPAEVDALAESLVQGPDQPFDAIVLAPWFLDGGRVTRQGVHYARIGEQLVPVADTEFARDAAFGYTHSYLPDWVAEKTAGRIAAAEVTVFALQHIRAGGPTALAAALLARPAGGCVVFDAVHERDVEVVVAALLAAEAGGRRYLYRSAASLVRVRAGIEPRPLLDPATLAASAGPDDPGGPLGSGRLVVVGSHVARSTEQLAHLLDHATAAELQVVEVGTDAALANPGAEARRCAAAVDAALAAGDDVVLHTERAVRLGADGDDSLRISAAISKAVVGAVAALTVRPALVVAKGGITSSDIATAALGVRRAEVLGQVQAGVAVWRCGPESRFPGLPYVVFPGNVGQPDSLSALLARRSPR
ncbi:MAG: four-carbon acid sugar kinase family protein [Acidimicrobiales bacterium]